MTTKRIVHTTPVVSSDDRMHIMDEDCWCEPLKIGSLSERYIIHHEPEPKVGSRWWRSIRANLSLTLDEQTNALASAGAQHGVFRQCSIGRHFECSDWLGQEGCECNCHEIAERAIMAAREDDDLP
jgi:hypothetical protein